MGEKKTKLFLSFILRFHTEFMLFSQYIKTNEKVYYY